MQPTTTSTSTQTISPNWGNPDIVAKFRAAAMQTGGISPERLDQYIQFQQQQYQQQNQNTITAVQGQNQGGAITPNQASTNPQGALNFLNSGGTLLKTGPDAQAQIINDSKNLFQKNVGTNGYVSPQLYNSQKADYVAAEGNAANFDTAFQDNYVNPDNVLYDTPGNKTIRGALPIVKNVLDSYHNLSITGPIVQDLENIPVVGKYIANSKLLAAQSAHDAFLSGQALKIKSLVQQGASQGFRNMAVLDNITSMLPSAEDSSDLANQKMDKLNTYMETNMGIGLKTLYGK
ncbi:MAG: hypothetical protein ABSE17_01125 [Candidatus Levyibacteriota bacterium]